MNDPLAMSIMTLPVYKNIVFPFVEPLEFWVILSRVTKALGKKTRKVEMIAGGDWMETVPSGAEEMPIWDRQSSRRN